MSEEIVKKYTNGEITVIWQPRLCSHSTICWKGLGEVFDPRKRPWVNMAGADSERIAAQVEKCPSGALSYFRNTDSQPESKPETKPETPAEVATTFEVLPNGPLVVRGNIVVKNQDGEEERKGPKTSFCRCGQSARKPYCDGSHKQTGFEG